MIKTAQEVRREIWERWKRRGEEPITLAKLAEEYGLGRSTVGLIIRQEREKEEGTDPAAVETAARDAEAASAREAEEEAEREIRRILEEGPGDTDEPEPETDEIPGGATAPDAPAAPLQSGSPAAPGWHPEDAPGLVAPARRRSGATAPDAPAATRSGPPAAPGLHPEDAPGLVAPARRRNGATALMDIGLCGMKAGASCWRATGDGEFRASVKLRGGNWDDLSMDELEEIGWDLLEISAAAERLAAIAREEYGNGVD